MDRLTNLLLRAQAGDRDALESFVAASQSDVWRLCRHLGDARDADDLTQETYERALGALHRFRADGPARGWLLTIARRTCVDHTRRAVRRRRLDGDLRHEATSSRFETLVRDEPSERIALDDLLVRLDRDRRAAFVLTQVLGLPYDEAAEVLNCPIGTIRSRVARARADLIAMTTTTTTAADGSTTTVGGSNETHFPAPGTNTAARTTSWG